MDFDMIMDISNRMERDMRIDIEKNDELYKVRDMNNDMMEYSNLKIKYNTTFDFLESSNEWNANKLKIGQGHYKYICGNSTKSGNKCKNKPIVDGDGKCHLHCNKV
jgi:hypothetical protein